VFPDLATQPTASNLNYLAGQVVPNGVLVKVGTAEQITLFANAGCPDVVVDVVGYYASGTPVVAGGFQGLQPRRLLDTREFGQGPCVTGTRDLTVTGGLTTVPDTAAAVALNVTVVSPYAPGYVTVFPKGATRPTASNLNYRAGQIVPNNVVVKVGSAGQISLFAFDGCPNLVVDVVGYFEGGSPVGDGGFTGVTPKRLLDTREPGQTPCVSSVRNLTVTGGLTTIPANAAAVALNVTVAAPTDSGFLTVFPAGATQPTASTLNFVSGQVVPNGTVVKVGTGGQISLFANSGCPQVIVDVLGYYTDPNPTTTTTSSSSTSTTTPVNPGALNFTQVSAGDAHTCGITTGGAAYCWGYNLDGELGNNSTTNSSRPVAVSGFTSGVTQISAGVSHTCAVRSEAAYCWGSNLSGQVGDGSLIEQIAPIQVVDLASGVAQVTVGYEHSCARTLDGALVCWGGNDYGQLGNASNARSLTPVLVQGLTSGALDVEAGGFTTCGVSSAGAALCWGYGFNGQLGNGGTADSTVPVAVATLTSSITAVTTGGFPGCARRTTGAVSCWGDNLYGQLGIGTTTRSLVPVKVVDP